MELTQTLQNPFGISVFGSSIVRIEPDTALLRFAVSRLAERPREAFQATRQATQGVRAYLAKARISDVSSSRITLSQSHRWTGGEQRFVGYNAKVAFHVLLYDLDRIEEILVGVVEAGADEITAIDLQTSRLKEVRARARQRAIDAAREKAEVYCKAAGVTLGRVIHIEDVNPERLRGTGEGHVSRESALDDEGERGAFDPGSIVVGAAVVVAFELGDHVK